MKYLTKKIGIIKLRNITTNTLVKYLKTKKRKSKQNN